MSASAFSERRDEPGTFDVGAEALRRAAATVAALSPEQRDDLVAGRAQLVLQPVARSADTAMATGVLEEEPDTAPVVRAGRRAPDPELVAAAVRAIRGLSTPAEVAEHLDRHRYSVPALREIALALGPTVSTRARNRAGWEHNIVEGTAGYRARSAAMSGGAWS
jgi:hypothetical protein